MLSKMRKMDNKGFTLIELMIVIAIIGILAAIAIPNFIAYRNKAFCTAAEKDANTVAAGIAEYFSIPSNRTVSKTSLTNGSYVATTLSNANTWSLNMPSVDNIWITVADTSKRCPSDYREAQDSANDPRAYWNNNNYIKAMSNT